MLHPVVGYRVKCYFLFFFLRSGLGRDPLSARNGAGANIRNDKDVEDFGVRQSKGVPDTGLERVAEKKF